jgi:murein DD-endopeptidase MepM/ murein hydrolase activator NlpD
MPVDVATAIYNLNLRQGPGLDQPVIVVLTQGTQLGVARDLGEWLEVRAPDGTSGYVSKQFVEIRPAPMTTSTSTPANPASTTPSAPRMPSAPSPASPTPATPAAVQLTKRKVTPTGDFINVRGTPMIAPDNIVGRADAGAELTPLEDDDSVAFKVGSTQEQNLWLRVRTSGGQEGYVAAWLVKLTLEGGAGTVAFNANAPVQDLKALYDYIATIPDADYPLPQGYRDFQAQRQRIGLPDPFDVSPTLPTTYDLRNLVVNGFGPNTFSFLNWQSYYRFVCGMHNGLDHIVPAGTPLLAVSDGIIVGTQAHWPFLFSKFEQTLVLWPFLPDSVRDSQGRRMLSNVLVAYGHMSNNTSYVKRHDVVKAGQVIGLSGFPTNQNKDGNPAPETGNPHLHLEVHLLSGDTRLPRSIGRNPGLLRDYNRPQPFDTNTPFNPLLFFSPRLVKYHLHQGKKSGFGGGPTYPSAAALAGRGLGTWPALDFFTISCFQYGSNAIIWNMTPPWANGIYDLPTLVQRVQQYAAFEPYPADFL